MARVHVLVCTVSVLWGGGEGGWKLFEVVEEVVDVLIPIEAWSFSVHSTKSDLFV